MTKKKLTDHENMNQAHDENVTMPAWTRQQLIAELRKAGWKRESGPAVIYVSPAGVKFHLDQYRRHLGGVIWHYFAERRELPADDFPPF